jgi:predicted metal-binding membrane protein
MSDGSMTPGSAGMSNMSGNSIAPAANAMMGIRPWTATEFGLVLIMWAMMMVAMMVPTAAPMTLMYAAVARKAATRPNPLGATFVFVGGYIAIWTVFSLVVTIAQFALDRAALLSPMLVSTSAATPANCC